MIALIVLIFNKESEFSGYFYVFGSVFLPFVKYKLYSMYPILSISKNYCTSSIGCFSIIEFNRDNASLMDGLTSLFTS